MTTAEVSQVPRTRPSGTPRRSPTPDVQVDASGDAHSEPPGPRHGPAGADLARSPTPTPRTSRPTLSSPRPSTSTTPPATDRRNQDLRHRSDDVTSIDLDNFSQLPGLPELLDHRPHRHHRRAVRERRLELPLQHHDQHAVGGDRSTYDSAHRLASRSVLGASNNGTPVPVTTQSATYHRSSRDQRPAGELRQAADQHGPVPVLLRPELLHQSATPTPARSRRPRPLRRLRAGSSRRSTRSTRRPRTPTTRPTDCRPRS